MSNPPVLLFGIHCHQPVGNFHRVMEEAYQKAYLPFLEVAKEHQVPFALHYSGPLIEWLETNGHRVLNLVGELVERNQVEVLISGLYEPILPAIPSWDRLGQLEMAKEKVISLWGKKPKGVWLTERVWEPQIVKEILAAGLSYVVVDDYHLLCAGIEEEKIHGYFVTEEDGETLAIFPISKPLRYLVPFKGIREVKTTLQGLSTNTAYTIFDDGEKFGLWPGTHSWVYQKGWLKRFFELLEEGWLKPSTFWEYLSKNQPTGRVYLPTASYPEMGEWVLSPQKAKRLREIKKNLEKKKASAFIRGGIWKNFLVKYPESNWLHKRMLRVSKEVKAIKVPEKKREAQTHLYKAQCNDAYWHGVFGGLYSPHLRRALWCQLLQAQRLVDAHNPGIIKEDLDCDGQEEIMLSNGQLFAAFKPHQGGGMVELSNLGWCQCFTNVLTRRPEAYHFEMEKRENKKGIPSIHERGDSLPSKIPYDPYQKISFLDHLLLNPSKKALEEGTLKGESLWRLHYLPRINGHKIEMWVRTESKEGEVEISKVFSLTENALVAEYRILPHALSMPLRFGFELNILFPSERFGEIRVLSGEEERCLSVLKGGVVKGCKGLILRDSLWGGELKIELGSTMDLWVSANLSISKSERGFDRIYQGNAFLFASSVLRDKMNLVVKVSCHEKGE